jgi:hypothetical protein
MKTHQNDKLKALQKKTGGGITIYFSGGLFAVHCLGGELRALGSSIDHCCDRIERKIKGMK